MNEKIYKMSFNKIYEALVAKAVKKGRTIDEVNQVISWLTGYSEAKINELNKTEINYADFFNKAKINPAAKLITGVICGVRVEEIEDELYRNIRYLDKLIDELAKGKDINKICRNINTIEEYLLIYKNERLIMVYDIFKENLKDCEEKMSWGMPTFYKKGNIIHFAVNKNHIGIYPGAEVIELFKNKFDDLGFKHSKGAVQLPNSKDLPKDLIKEMCLKALEVNS